MFCPTSRKGGLAADQSLELGRHLPAEQREVRPEQGGPATGQPEIPAPRIVPLVGMRPLGGGRANAGRGALDMNDAAARDVANGPARRVKTVHQLDFLEIEEETVIEEARLPQRVDAKHHAGARHPVSFHALLVLDDNAPDAEHPAQFLGLRSADKLPARRWKPKRRCRDPAARSQQLAAGRAAPRIVLKLRSQRADCAGLNFSIRIEQVDEFRRMRLPRKVQDCLVIRPSEAAVHSEREERHPVLQVGSVGEFAEDRSRVVARPPVDDDGAQTRQTLSFAAQGLDAAHRQVGRPIIDNDYSYVSQ